MKIKSSPLDIALSEKAFEAQVKELAKLFGWLYYHTWTSVHSPRGFVDIVMVRAPRIIFAEIKSEKGKLTSYQEIWLDSLKECDGIEAYLWRPSQFEEIVEVLR